MLDSKILGKRGENESATLSGAHPAKVSGTHELGLGGRSSANGGDLGQFGSYAYNKY
jgi:hypothetical protein